MSGSPHERPCSPPWPSWGLPQKLWAPACETLSSCSQVLMGDEVCCLLQGALSGWSGGLGEGHLRRLPASPPYPVLLTVHSLGTEQGGLEPGFRWGALAPH